MQLTYHKMKLLLIDISKEQSSHSVSINLFGEQGHYFASKRAFYCVWQEEKYYLSPSTLEDFDTMRWTNCWNPLPLPLDFQSVSTKHIAVLGDTKLVMVFNGIVYVFDMSSKKYGGIPLDSEELFF